MFSGKNFSLLLIVILLAGLGAGAFMLFRDQQPPALSITPASGTVGPGSVINVQAADTASGLRSLAVTLRQHDRSVSLPVKPFATGQQSLSVEFPLTDIDLKASKFKDGTVEINVTSVDASFAGFGEGNTAVATQEVTLDTQAPRITVDSIAHNIRQGGAGLVVYTLTEEAAASGIRVGDVFFPGYRQPDGSYLCLFAFPYYMETDQFAPVVEAEDAAGNRRTISFNYHTIARKFPSDVINLPDRFLNSKMPNFEDSVPGQMTQLERFLKVNREIRKVNRSALLNLGRRTSPEILWEGSFLRLPNAANRAGFGDRRVYKYKGQEIDRQTHLGIDLASLRKAPVPAANNGTVVYADDFGIYGQCIIIDHGLGLQSLYAHLSSFKVQEGDTVKRGQIIGNTGATGLAGGDHLHFGIILSGIPVTPVEWWDGRWIRHNVTGKIQPVKQ